MYDNIEDALEAVKRAAGAVGIDASAWNVPRKGWSGHYALMTSDEIGPQQVARLGTTKTEARTALEAMVAAYRTVRVS